MPVKTRQVETQKACELDNLLKIEDLAIAGCSINYSEFTPI